VCHSPLHFHPGQGGLTVRRAGVTIRGALLRRAVLMALAPLALVGCGPAARPNILLVVIDTARADRFPFDGYERPTAPALTALAGEGAIYTQAFSPAPWTVPAHASLFTGQYPSLHHTDCGSLRLPDAAVTLAEILRDAGYRTVGYTGNPWVSTTYNFDQGFDTFVETWRNVPRVSEDTGAAQTNEQVLRFLRWRRDSPEASRQPFFLFINYFEPHLPYHPPEPERSRLLRPGADPAAVQRLSRLGHPEEMRFILGVSDLTPRDLAILNDLYDGEIAYVDRRVGEVLALLREQGILDRTVVAIAGDHGENIGDHHMMDHKMSVHDTLLHVPLLLRYPPRVKGGQRIDAPVQLHDLQPTLLALAGVVQPAGATVEAVPLPGTGIDGPRRQAGDPIVGEFVGPPVDFLKVMQDLFPKSDLSRFNRTLIALRSGDYKITWGSDGRHALFNIGEDPGETRDLAALEPDRLREMAGRVREWLARPARRSLPAPPRQAAGAPQ
jgi:arylsulfatase A-like enzyme